MAMNPERDVFARAKPVSLAGPLIGFGIVGLLGLTVAASTASASSKKPKPKPDPNPSPPDNGPKPDKPPPADEDIPPPVTPPGTLLERYPGLQMDDRRKQAPKDLILRLRTLAETTAVVLHQTGFFGWKPTNPNWAKVNAHFVVRRDGSVVINYDPEVRMTHGSNAANKFCVTIEHEGNYANSNGNFYKPEKFGRSYLKDAPNQVKSSRLLIEILHELCPKMTAVFAHCQWTGNRQNCCGPELWSEVGEWAKAHLAMTDGGPGWYWEEGTGQPIPNSWRGLNA